MTKHQVISKAQKIASRMKSPFPNEVAIAAMKLRQLLAEYGLSMSDVGLGNLDISNMVNKTHLRDVVNTPGTTHDVTSEANIKEVVYKHLITEMDVWFLCVLLKIAHAYETMILGDRYGRTWAEKSCYLKLIGFSEDIEIVKNAIVNIRHFIENQILIRGYTKKIQVANYGLGLADTIILRIKEENDYRSTYESRILSRSKSLKLSQYLYRCYGLTTDCDHPLNLGRDKDAYRTGLYDGHNFFRHKNSCKEAFTEALKHRAETSMPKTPYYSSVDMCREG